MIGNGAIVAFVFDDPVPPLAIAGMVLIVGGVVLVSASGAKTH